MGDWNKNFDGYKVKSYLGRGSYKITELKMLKIQASGKINVLYKYLNVSFYFYFKQSFAGQCNFINENNIIMLISLDIKSIFLKMCSRKCFYNMLVHNKINDIDFFWESHHFPVKCSTTKYSGHITKVKIFWYLLCLLTFITIKVIQLDLFVRRLGNIDLSQQWKTHFYFNEKCHRKEIKKNMTFVQILRNGLNWKLFSTHLLYQSE